MPWWAESEPDDSGKIFRYDRLVDEFVSLNSFSSLQRMNTEFPVPTRLLIEEVLGIGSVQDALVEQRLRDFFLDSTMQVLLVDVHAQYRELEAEEGEISSVFRQVKKADPQFKVPFIYAQISGLNQSIVVGDSLLGISLDKYLGADYPLYNRFYYDYQRRMMRRDRLVPDALFHYLSYSYPLPGDKVHTLLDAISEYGKFHWVIARCRGVELEQEAGFDAERVAWYRTHEAETWEWLTSHDALSSADLTMIRLFMAPRGNTPCLGKESPDQIGMWIGLQIVDHYMKSHPEVGVAELLRMNDYGAMLRESGYQPSSKK